MKFFIYCGVLSAFFGFIVLSMIISDGSDAQELCAISNNDNSLLAIHGYGDNVYCDIIAHKFILFLVYFTLLFLPVISILLYTLKTAWSMLRRYQTHKTRRAD